MTDLSIDTSGPLRRFADSNIAASVDAVLATLSPDKRGAVLAIADGDGARLAAVARLADGWSVVGVLERKWSGEIEGQAVVRFDW